MVCQNLISIAYYRDLYPEFENHHFGTHDRYILCYPSDTTIRPDDPLPMVSKEHTIMIVERE